MRFGEELKQERERRGISLDDVAVSTRVSLRHLYALENDRFSDLPGGVFNRGIVRSYAQYCGLDADGTVQNFLTAARASGVEPEPPEDGWVELAEAVRRNRPKPPPRQPARWWGVLLLMVAVLALAAAVCWLLIHRGIIQAPEKTRRASDEMLQLIHRGR